MPTRPSTALTACPHQVPSCSSSRLELLCVVLAHVVDTELADSTVHRHGAAPGRVVSTALHIPLAQGIGGTRAQLHNVGLLTHRERECISLPRWDQVGAADSPERAHWCMQVGSTCLSKEKDLQSGLEVSQSPDDVVVACTALPRAALAVQDANGHPGGWRVGAAHVKEIPLRAFTQVFDGVEDPVRHCNAKVNAANQPLADLELGVLLTFIGLLAAGATRSFGC